MNFDLRGIKGILVSLAAAVALVLSVLNAVIGVLPGDVETLGTTNFDTLQVESGSASAPSLSFTDDPDVGLFRRAANTLGLTVGGSEVVSITSSGLNLEGVAFNGPVVLFGGLVSNAVTLAHGLGATPTFAFCGLNGAGAISQTIYITSALSDATNITVKVIAGSSGLVSTHHMTPPCLATK